MPSLITDSEAADILRLTTRQVVKLAKIGLLPSVNLPGGEIRFDIDDLCEWVDSRKRPVMPHGGKS
jgi:excisionase family DNA binding protein